MKFASKLSSDNRLQICHVWIVKPLFYIYENWSPHFTNPLPLFIGATLCVTLAWTKLLLASELAALDNNKLTP